MRAAKKIRILLNPWHHLHIVTHTDGIQTNAALLALSLGRSSYQRCFCCSSSSVCHVRIVLHKAVGSSVNRARARRISRLFAVMKEIHHAGLVIHSIRNGTPIANLCKAVGLGLDRHQRGCLCRRCHFCHSKTQKHPNERKSLTSIQQGPKNVARPKLLTLVEFCVESVHFVMVLSQHAQHSPSYLTNYGCCTREKSKKRARAKIP